MDIVVTFTPGLVDSAMSQQLHYYLKKKVFEDVSPFHGASDTSVLDLVTSALGFKVRMDPLLACNKNFRFTSGAIPADLLKASIAVKPF